MQLGLEKLGKSGADSAKLFEEADSNHDGKIEFFEFGSIYYHLKNRTLKQHKR
jgi:Ca2+-binding EF-hand superfamily protein